MDRLEAGLRDVPDFPKPGIVFKDITPILADPALLKEAIERIVSPFDVDSIDAVAGIESRGFILGVPVALTLEKGFIPIRKPGKLPCETYSATFELEYGTDSLEIHKDAVGTGDRILLVDDVLATGGTAQAACHLIETCGGSVGGIAFLLELTFLEGRGKLQGRNAHTVLRC